MTSWLRRLSRDRSKYAEEDPDMFRPRSSQLPETTATKLQQQQQQLQQPTATRDSEFPPTPPSGDMIRRNFTDSQPQQWPQQSQPRPHSNPPVNGNPIGFEQPPDFLTRAFNDGLRPYQERIKMLEGELEASNQRISRLEQERADLHNWIDKRGLRPDLPLELAGPVANDPVAASQLASQLERKMTMINYSLHHLTDSLPSLPPMSTITSSLSALLPTIGHLSTLPGGPPFAFECLIKLAGNLNSHSTGEETIDDRQVIANFYDDLDQTMDRVVGKRVIAVAEREEKWDIARDVKRLEKTGAFLRKEMGVNNYFVKSLELMRGGARDRGPQGEPQTRYSSDSR